MPFYYERGWKLMDNILIQAKMKMNSIKLDISSADEKSTEKLGTEIAASIREKIEESKNSSEQNDEKMMTKIMAKLKSGKKLSQKEESYLKQHDPELYIQYLRIRRMAETMASRLKHANSKEEVNDIIMQSISGISDKDQYKEYIVAALDEVAKEFKKSDNYRKLPSTSEEAEEKKKSLSNNDSFSEDNFDDDFDPMSWSPLQELVDTMPKFEAPA